MWDLRGDLEPTARKNLAALWSRLKSVGLDCSFRAPVENLLQSTPSGWHLYHPVFNYLHVAGDVVMPSPRDLQLAFWLGSHPWADASDELNVVEEVTVWNCRGPQRLRPGKYSVSHFRDEALTQQIAWDVAGLVTAGPRQDMWPQGNEAASRELRGKLAGTLAVLDEFQADFPHIFDWAAHATRILVPLRQRPDGRVRSGSLAEEVGTAYLDLSSPVCFLESLVHESAHQHLYLYEQTSILVPVDETLSFYSPLKKTMRPLRGIFLAYHALACIAQLYSELLRERAFDEASLAKTLGSVLSDLEVASAGMKAGQAHLTNAGLALFEQIESRRALVCL